MDPVQKLKELYKAHFKEDVATYTVFSGSGSTWRYRARLVGKSGRSVLGVVNARLEENRAFIEFGKTFLSCGLPVPVVYIEKEDAYLEEDVGEKTLDQVLKESGACAASDALIEKAVRLLPHFQIAGGKKIDYSLCYAFDRYGKGSVEWDVGYFKRCFLGALSIPFNEALIKQEGTILGEYIEQVSGNYFVNRDYQNRNIVIGKDECLVVIDYQQGRAGGLQYDIAKYLAQPSLALSEVQVQKFLRAYLDEAQSIDEDFDENEFLASYPCFELIQGLQRLGGYANIGLIQKVGDFNQKIVPAVLWFKRWLERATLPVKLPEITRCLVDITQNYEGYLSKIK